ncbi:hypothetical protein Kpol_1053p16 [Vanderwaltozyma polyspora DSM 70294]|uniref:Phosphatidylglycerol/phosphatidylinositol transfer protein n=1 Tax=Vanderwaltozyma polyspora (strain ATCC 22028 / DSM 70294 / BCRC 21397 / CBS 2163 / NBRC 10782 / NRRL Y-8283 / UCD 57-17) TaxID=436907 RepID=A7TN61_VANPO|nr:uncharacterized protein Kpol_1053p16 [Vanderwaltozyma polyspora DSM 70294]EDO16279.1 hypothetical protein Kpol_1053p16 [Vanderwaltozyma polyspora DSM 70294]
MLLTVLLFNFLTFFLTFGNALVVPFALEPPLTKKPIAGGTSLATCDVNIKQLLSIEKVSLNPNPPKRGGKLSITASGTVDTEIKKGAYIDVEVRLGYIKLLTQTFDLCEVLSENDVNGLKCPITAGQYNLNKDVDIPEEVPPGKYTILARAYTVEDEFITCITGDFLFPAAF